MCLAGFNFQSLKRAYMLVSSHTEFNYCPPKINFAFFKFKMIFSSPKIVDIKKKFKQTMKLTCCLDTSFAHKTNSSSSLNVCKWVYISSRCYRFLSQRLDNISIKRRWQNFIFTVTREGETNKKQTLFTTTGTRHCWGRQRDTPQCHTRRILGSDKLYSFIRKRKY